jgi:Fe-S oxidoreductase
MKPASPDDARALALDPSSPGFFDLAEVGRELRRVAEVCHGCRRCYNLCPSFDVLFRALDRPDVEGDVGDLPDRDLADFSDLCYECRLCVPHCPYRPPHASAVDVPRLVIRDRAARVKSDGKPRFRERVLASADALGRIASPLAPIVNALGEIRPLRVLAEKALGVHRDRLLPRWSDETFYDWWRRRGGATAPEGRAPARDRVALFVGCSVNANNPEIGRAAVAVLEKNGCEIAVPPPRCCGMPSLECGDLDEARECRGASVSGLLPFVRAGYAIVCPAPTCSLMLRAEYPALGAEAEAREVAAGTMDLCEYLVHALAGEGRLPGALPPAGPGRRVPVARSAAAHPGRQGRHGRAVHGARRHVEHEDGVLPDLDADRPARLPGDPKREAGSRRLRLPARGRADPAGNRPGGPAPDPDRRRGVRVARRDGGLTSG